MDAAVLKMLFDGAAKNDPCLITKAINLGADLNCQHPRAGTLVLQIACQFNSLKVIKILLENGAHPGLKFSRISRVDGRRFLNHTPLMYVRCAEAARMLVEAGANNLEDADEKGWTPLVYAAYMGYIDVVDYLLSVGAQTSPNFHHGGSEVSLIELMEHRISLVEMIAQTTPGNADKLINLKTIKQRLVS